MKPKTTRSQIEEFESSLLWQDILNELKEWEDSLTFLYDEASDLLQLGKIQGGKEAISFFRNFLSDLKEEADEKDEEIDVEEDEE